MSALFSVRISASERSRERCSRRLSAGLFLAQGVEGRVEMQIGGVEYAYHRYLTVRASRQRPVASSIVNQGALELGLAVGALVAARHVAQELAYALLRLDADDGLNGPGHAEICDVAGAFGRTRASEVCTCVCVPQTALTRPSRK